MSKISKAPPTLSADGKKLWSKILNTCKISEVEIVTLRLMLEALDECNEIRAEIKKTGPTFETKSGDFRLNPLEKALLSSRQVFLQCFRILGFKEEQPVRKVGRPVEKVEYDFDGGD